jgi:hypothetical protein
LWHAFLFETAFKVVTMSVVLAVAVDGAVAGVSTVVLAFFPPGPFAGAAALFLFAGMLLRALLMLGI